MRKKYFSEILLLTKSYYPEELQCWIQWYLDILGFDHIVIFNNESPIDIESVISPYKDKIELFSISCWPNQHKLYTDYSKESKSQWMIPFDDDELLYLSDHYNHSVTNFIEYFSGKYHKNMIYPLWLNMLSKNPITSKEDLYINTHTFFSYRAYGKISLHYSNSNVLGKCFINTDYEYNYIDSVTPCHHIPRCLNGDYEAVVPDGTFTKTDRVYRPGYTPNCFIAHYQFKTKSDWVRKCNNQLVSTDKCTLFGRKGVYDLLYSYKDLFTECTLVKDLWEKYKSI